MDTRIKRGIIGTSSSIIASILILMALLGIYSWGIEVVFAKPCIYVLALLIPVGLAAYYGYLRYSRISLWRMKYISPVALALGAIAIMVGVLEGAVLGGALVFLSYIIETSVGIKLYEDYRDENRLGALLFIVGVTLFVISLPLIILNHRLALLGVAGDLIKLSGLILVLFGILEKAGY